MADEVDVFDSPVVSDPPDNSKREYLLLQIRQKDAIIESLLKQVSADFYGLKDMRRLFVTK